MEIFWEEVRAVARKGWVVLGGAAVTLVGLVQGAVHKSWPSALWWIPLLVGVIGSEFLVILDRRRTISDYEERLDGVMHHFVLNGIECRWTQTVDAQNGIVHDVRVRPGFHNTSSEPIRWEVDNAEFTVSGNTSECKMWEESTQGGIVGPGKLDYLTFHIDVRGHTQLPKEMDIAVTILYDHAAADDLTVRERHEARFDVPEAASTTYRDMEYLRLRGSRVERII